MKSIIIRLIVALVGVFFVLKVVDAASCADYKSTNLPCTEIPMCSSTAKSSIGITQLSNGFGLATSSSSAQFCHTKDALHIDVLSTGQKYLGAPNQFETCNDSVFNMDVVELFIAPHSDQPVKCYSEIDTSPYGPIFESRIYSPNLNHTGIVGTLIDCGISGITTKTSIATDKSWQWHVSVPWSLINDASWCPASVPANTLNVYRGNLYRVNELKQVGSSCSSSTCEYMAWSPTLANPPAFHEPTKFGFFVLV